MGPVRGCRVWRLHVADRPGRGPSRASLVSECGRGGWVLERCGGMWGQARSVRGGGPGGRPPCVFPGPPAFLYRRAFVHAWPPHGSGGPLLQNCHDTGLCGGSIVSEYAAGCCW